MSKLELYHWEPAGDSAKVLIGLHEKGVKFDGHYVDVPGFEQYQPSYLKLAPMGQVPVLVHDGEVFNEPRLLLEYLEDAFPEPALAPAGAAGWYDAQEWIRYADAQLGEAVNLLGWHTAALPSMSEAQRKEIKDRLASVPVKEQQAGWAAVVRDAESTEDRLENARGKVCEAIRRIEGTLAGSKWLAGRDYSIADINAYALARTLPQLMPGDVNEKLTPKVLAWLRAIEARPAVQSALAIRGGSPGHAYRPA